MLLWLIASRTLSTVIRSNDYYQFGMRVLCIVESWNTLHLSRSAQLIWFNAILLVYLDKVDWFSNLEFNKDNKNYLSVSTGKHHADKSKPEKYDLVTDENPYVHGTYTIHAYGIHKRNRKIHTKIKNIRKWIKIRQNWFWSQFRWLLSAIYVLWFSCLYILWFLLHRSHQIVGTTLIDIENLLTTNWRDGSSASAI